jgi:hypothetical protein
MKTKMSDIYEKVHYTGIDRPEYILKNGKALNVYGALIDLQTQQTEIDELKAQLELIRKLWLPAADDIQCLFHQQPRNREDGSYLIDGQSCQEVRDAIYGKPQQCLVDELEQYANKLREDIKS